MMTEEQVIQKIAGAVPGANARGLSIPPGGLVRLGIGDDAAIIAPKRGKDWVLSCDAFLEGVHFLPNVHPPDAVGWKSLVRATSDLAAMGATPRLFLLTLALPKSKTSQWLDGFARGMGRAAKSLSMQLAGGDTTENARVAISITVLGEIDRGKAGKRSGARVGDIIYVSGCPGRADLGLRLLQLRLGLGAGYASLIRPHFYPEIRVELGQWLAKGKVASAMMDISDGLSTDLGRLAEASGVGARIWSERLPTVAVPAELGKRAGFDPLELALHGGDDYELLFTVPRRKVRMLKRAPGGSKLRAIGEITGGEGVQLVNARGQEQRLEAGGWDPFKKR